MRSSSPHPPLPDPPARPRRFGPVALALAGVLLASATAAPSPTEASWIDQESALSVFTARAVPAPVLIECRALSVLGLFSAAEVTWRWAPGAREPDPRFAVRGEGAPWQPAEPIITDPADGVHRAVFTKGLLEDLLGSLHGTLFGTTSELAVGADENGWHSPMSTVSVTVGTLGLTSDCTTGASIPAPIDEHKPADPRGA